MSDPHPIRSYAEFWPFYLREHARGATRALHILGTVTAGSFIVAAAALQNWWLLPGALVAGYGPAWIAHFFVEKNRPATFRYPLWSLISDFRMTGKWFVGGLARELERAGVRRD
jgi:hypothetical protein